MDRRTIVSGTLGVALVACAAGVVDDRGSTTPLDVEATAEGVEGSQIVGFVVDSESGEPQGGALVVLQCECLQGTRETQTNADGIFAFRNLPPGEYQVDTYMGKGQVARRLRLDDGKRVRLHLSVNPRPRMLT